MTSPGPIAFAAVAVAEAEASSSVREEGGNNRGPRVEEYLRTVGLSGGNPWCAAFVSFCLRTADQDLQTAKLDPTFPLTGWCPAFGAWAKARGLWIPCLGAGRLAGADAPQRGDLALFYFAPKGRLAHVGILATGLGNGMFRTIEGNTSGPATAGVNREGDGVFVKTRTLPDLGTLGGFVRLPF